MTLNLAREVELTKKIRSIEADLFRDSILTEKAVQGVIKQGQSQNKLDDDNWLRREVQGKGEQIRRSQGLGNYLRNVNSEPRSNKLAKLTNHNIKPKPAPIVPKDLSPIICEHEITFKINRLPEYQEMEKYTRFSVLVEGFEYEIHVGINKFRDLIKLDASGGPWVAVINGHIKDETAKGFLIPDGRMKIGGIGLKRGEDIQADKRHPAGAKNGDLEKIQAAPPRWISATR